MIRKVEIEDAFELSEIYNYYILNTVVTFELTKIDKYEMEKRIAAITSQYPWLVYEKDGQIKGYAYASQWRKKTAYKHSVESTIYLKHSETSQGIGSTIYMALIQQLQESGYHSIIGGVSLPNDQSIRLHEKLGFKKVAHFSEVGRKFEQWIDVGFWELIK